MRTHTIQRALSILVTGGIYSLRSAPEMLACISFGRFCLPQTSQTRRWPTTPAAIGSSSEETLGRRRRRLTAPNNSPPLLPYHFRPNIRNSSVRFCRSAGFGSNGRWRVLHLCLETKPASHPVFDQYEKLCHSKFPLPR